MDTKRLEKFAPEARRQMLAAVRQRMYRYALDDDGRAACPAGSDVTREHVLTIEEKRMRDELFRRVEEQGADAFAEQAAYTWFNRLVAIRYMEVHGYLPCRMRILSSAEDTFDPECLREAASLDLPGLDPSRVLACIQSGDDESLYRDILVAQGNELAQCMPSVFGAVGAADALMLPDGLTRKDAENVLYRLVTNLPQSEWGQVETLGWLYQFYNSERKADFFKAKRKAAPEDIAPATQLFTPDWIVRYMVENSLGRLWMLNNPGSRLREQMDYYIEPDSEHEEFLYIDGPEDITFCDPACGSGHILVYAFQLLFAMYQERGYAERDIPSLILSKNLTGYEVDERAGQLASLALTMCAREHDRRFFRRDVRPNIRVFRDIMIDAGSLDPDSALVDKAGLLDVLAHLGEIGSLLDPTSDDLEALRSESMRNLSGDLFAGDTGEAVCEALDVFTALSTRFDVVVANPPYMGSSSFNPWMSKWVKKNYPDVKSDLCTCFIQRGYTLAIDRGYTAMVTMQSWMFLSSFEKMRDRLIDEKSIVTMAHLGPRAFDAIGGEVVSVTADVLYNGKTSVKGAYVRLVDINGSEAKRKNLLEAIANPDCCWFYRADASAFHDIPGTPIAYWVSHACLSALKNMPPLDDRLVTREGMATADNDRFVREWWEVSKRRIGFCCSNIEEAAKSRCRWFPYQKGGEYRKWYGNNDLIVNWEKNGFEIKNNKDVITGRIRSHNYNGNYAFQEGITWSALSSGRIHIRYSNIGSLFDSKGAKGFTHNSKDLLYIMGLLNSSVSQSFLSFLAPTLDYKVGDVIEIPDAKMEEDLIRMISSNNVSIAITDYNRNETSWNFKKNPLL